MTTLEIVGLFAIGSFVGVVWVVSMLGVRGVRSEEEEVSEELARWREMAEDLDAWHAGAGYGEWCGGENKALERPAEEEAGA